MQAINTEFVSVSFLREKIFYKHFLYVFFFCQMGWKQDNVESMAAMLIAVPEPFGGALIIGGHHGWFDTQAVKHHRWAPWLVGYLGCYTS
jgi:hypothetical protein